MGFFDKKYCDVCGEKIGLLGNRKLEDGNLCKDCAKKLSPFFNERRVSTVEEIKQQLAYREENKRQLVFFNPNHIIGTDKRVYIDENTHRFIITSSSSWRESNPDIIDISQVTSCNLDIKEDKDEIMRIDGQGNKVSYNPPRYKCEYIFNVEITVNSPWFSTIRFELTRFGNRPDSRYTDLYRDYERQADELRHALIPSLYGNLHYSNVHYDQQTQYQGQQGYQQQRPYTQQEFQQPYQNERHNKQYQQPMSQSGMWACQNCNTQNTGKFCEGCGAPQPQSVPNAYNSRVYFYKCDKCGWTPTDPNNLPRFCPQCGDIFNENDIN